MSDEEFSIQKRFYVETNADENLGMKKDYFDTIEEARKFLAKNGGGVVKKRGAWITDGPCGYFDKQAWGVIERVRPGN